MPRRMTESIEAQGEWLFRHRGGMGVIILPCLAAALLWPGTPGNTLGDAMTDDVTVLGMVVSILGLVMRWLTVGYVPADTSGRNTREQRAAMLNTDSAYSLVRHPLYLANGVVVTGLCIATGSLWFTLLALALYALAIERIVAAEERFLADLHGQDYVHWASRTPAFIPDFSRWRRPNLPLSGRTVLRREYNGVLGVALAFFVLEAVRDLLIEQQSWSAWLDDDGIWLWALGLGVLSFGVLRTIKRRTRWLHVRGR